MQIYRISYTYKMSIYTLAIVELYSIALIEQVMSAMLYTRLLLSKVANNSGHRSASAAFGANCEVCDNRRP